MRFGKFGKVFGPLAAMAVIGAMSGCSANFNIDGEEGVPLSELDTTGEAPTRIILAGPDRVTLTEGESLVIEPTGDMDEIEKLRFVLKDGTLGIHRDNEGDWGASDAVDIAVTMPKPTKITIAGSGKVISRTLARDGQIAIAGSGTADVSGIDSDELGVKIAGSGTFTGAGTAKRLRLNIVGSGDGDMAKLKVDRASIKVAGSGDAVFASDGTVEANVVGSGDVIVRGSAKCTIKAVGSGSLSCEPGDAPQSASAAEAPEGPATPEGPAAPEAPAAGE